MKKKYSISLVLSVFLFMGMNTVAQYCTPIAGSSTWGYISEVKSTGGVANFSKTTGSTYAYNDFTKSHGVISAPGKSFTISGKRTRNISMWVDWNGDNDFLDAGEWVLRETNSSTTLRTFTKTLTPPANAVVGVKTRIRLIAGYNGYMTSCGSVYSSGSTRYYYTGDVEDYYLFLTYDNNASMKKIASPTAECKGSAGTSVDVSFSNSGVKDLDTLYFAGEITNTFNFKTKIDTIRWTGNLKTGESVKTPFNVHNNSFNFKAGDTVCVWSFNPNNVPDSADLDDTICYVVLKGMSGTFSVGDTTSGQHDFRTLKDAVDSLNLAGAICDSVVFELHDTTWSAYKSQYEISDIVGTSPTSPIIIRPEAHNQYLTRVWFDSCSEDFNEVFLLKNVSDIYFEDIIFNATDGKGTGYATNIRVNNSPRVNFINCSFKNDKFNRNDEDFDLVVVDESDDLLITGCKFNSGSSALVVKNSNGINILKNTFTDMYKHGIDIKNVNNTTIKRNEIISKSTLISGSRAISLENANNSLDVSYNTVKASNGQWPQHGVFMDNCNALNSSIELYNNMINVGQSWSGVTFYSIFLKDVVGSTVLFNTCAVSGNSSSNSAFYAEGGTRNTIFSNIFAAMVSGYAINIPVSGSVVSGDNNAVYSGGGTVGRLGANKLNLLKDWQNASGLDINSVSVNPFFYKISTNDLHVCNDKLFQAGKSISSISDDWDGDSRDPKKPCIGADEFAPVSQFSLGSSFGLCDGDTTNLIAGKGLTGEIAIWKNGSGIVVDTNQLYTVKAPGKYSVTLLNACGINTDSIEIIAPNKVILTADTNICPTQTVSVDATTANGNTYKWSNGNTSTAITISKEGTYFVTATDKWNCLSSDSVNVTYSTPAVLTSGDTIVCQGAPFSVFGGISAIQPNVIYKWIGFNPDPGSVDNVFIDYDLMANDTTIVVELIHRGCKTIDSMKVIKKPKPTVKGIGFTTNGLALYITGNTSTGEDHNWNFDDNDSSAWPVPRHLYKKNGTYNVKYTNSNICGSVDTTMEVVIATLAVGEKNSNSKLNVYPNPNNGNFNIELSDITANDVSVRIIDTQGRTVFNKDFGNVSGSAKETVSLEGTGAGVYLIQLNIDGAIQMARITIE